MPGQDGNVNLKFLSDVTGVIYSKVTARSDLIDHVAAIVSVSERSYFDIAIALCLKLAGTPNADRPLVGMCDSARCPQATHHNVHRPVWAEHAEHTKTFLGQLGKTRTTEHPCDIKTLAHEASVDRTAFYGNGPYAHLRAEFKHRLQRSYAHGLCREKTQRRLVHRPPTRRVDRRRDSIPATGRHRYRYSDRRAVAAIMATLAEFELELGRERRASSRESRRTRGTGSGMRWPGRCRRRLGEFRDGSPVAASRRSCCCRSWLSLGLGRRQPPHHESAVTDYR